MSYDEQRWSLSFGNHKMEHSKIQSNNSYFCCQHKGRNKTDIRENVDKAIL